MTHEIVISCVMYHFVYMDFLAHITAAKLEHWMATHKKKLTSAHAGYFLECARPFWLDKASRSAIENKTILYTGKTKEEIFVRMYKHCLANLKWEDGKAADLLDYCIAFNEAILGDLITKKDDGYYITDNDGAEHEITEQNFDRFEDLIYPWIFERALYFYGFTQHRILDCCFYVKPVKNM